MQNCFPGNRAPKRSQVWLFDLRIFPLLLAVLTGMLHPKPAGAAGTWTPLVNQAPGGVGLMLLLSDGTVMCQNGGGWYRLTPDIYGSYVNGTWTTLAPMHDTRTYYSSQILRDGRVFVAGGEYGTGKTKAEIYNALSNTWTQAATPPDTVIDNISAMAPNGNVLEGFPGQDCRTYNPNTDTWSTQISILDGQDEAEWVKLQDGSVITIDPFGTNTERYIPTLNKWAKDSTVPVTMYGYGGELGAGFLLPNGKVFSIGGTSHTAIYTPWTTNSSGIFTPAGATNAGTWVAGPDIPNFNAGVDAPAAMMNNGKILCCMTDTNNSYGNGSYYYEYDYVANSFTQINAPTGGLHASPVAYGQQFLDLPDGTVLLSGFGSQVYNYKPSGSPITNGVPTILNITTNLDGSFHVTGTLFNGISDGAAYGDDKQMSTAFPVARMTNSSGNVLYCRTYNWSTNVVMTGTNVASTDMTLPAGLLAGTYPLFITANGFSSAPYLLTISGTPLPPVTGLAFSSVTSSQTSFHWNRIGLTEAGYYVQRSTDGTNYSALAMLGNTTTNYTDNGVAPLGQYYYRVVGTNAAGLGLAAPILFAASKSATPLPLPWQNQDVGVVLGSGASGTNAGTFTVIGSGSGIALDNDQFQFIYQPVAGDVTITARVISSQNTGSNAMAGVMIRSSTGFDVADALMIYNGGAQSSIFEHRDGAAALATYGLKIYGESYQNDAPAPPGGPSGSPTVVSQPASAPLWVRLVRTGNRLIGYTSTNGSDWTPQGTNTAVMPPVVQVGLAVTSGTYNQLNTSTFDNVTVTGTPALVPPAMAEWKLDETSGTIAKDSIDSFDGLYNNVALGLPGATPVSGYSAGFNGTSANISVPPLNLNSNVMTVTAWINPNGNQNAFSGIFFDRETSAANGFHFGTANELRYTWNNSSSTYNFNSGLVPPSNQWSFVALVIEPTRARIFMITNGVLVSATNNVANPVQMFGGSSCIGQDTTSSSRYFNGMLDDVKFFNQVLTPAQLAQMTSTPVISVSTPASGQEFLPPASVTISASLSATNGHTVNLVQLFNGVNLAGESSVAPYTSTVTGLAAGTYALTARLYYDSGLTVDSDPVTVVVEPAPATPANVTASALASNLVYVSWSPAAGADGYVLNRNGSPLVNLGAATSYYVDTGVVPGTSYCYSVIATNQVGNSTTSVSSCVTPSGSVTSLTWDASGLGAGPQDGNGVWDDVSSLWWNGSNDNVWTDGLLAVFGSGATTNCTISVVTNVTPGGILFNADAGSYTLTNGGGSIILTNTALFTISANATISALVTGSGKLVKAGPGYLLLNNTNNFTNSVLVRAGTLEVAAKSGDVAYVVTNGATLKIGYATGGGYANTGLKIYGDGVSASTGLYLVGGQNYNASGQIQLLGASTTIHQYGSGLAGIGMFDINGNGLWCSAAASGSAIDPNIQMVSRGYGMSVTIDPGANTATGDLVINGSLNAGTDGFYKRGSGSLLLTGTSSAGNAAFQLQGGTVLCGADDTLGTYATLTTSSGTLLDLETSSQTIAGTTLAGTLRMGINKTNALPNAQMISLSGALTLGGTLVVTNLGKIPLAAGDSFQLFNATTFTGNFSAKTLPVLSAGLTWNTSLLTNNGTISVAAAPAVIASPASTNFIYGSSAMLTAMATGTGPLSYQWFDNNKNLIAGATGPTLTLANPAVAAGGNYTVIVTNAYGKATNSSVITISQAALTVMVNNTNRAYGTLNPVFTPGYSGFVNGDTTVVLSGAPSLTTTADTNSPVGNYAIVAAPGTLSAANYSFGFTNGTLVVNPALLTVTANDTNRTYGATNPVFTVTFTNFANGENASVLSGAPSLTAVATTNSPVGSYVIMTGLGTLMATNYSFILSNGTLSIGAAPLTITANNANKAYGQNLIFTGMEITSSGLLNGDTVTNVELASAGATNSAPLGGYSITATNAHGNGLSNYFIAYVDGTLMVTNAAVVTPLITGSAALGSGGFMLGGTGGPGQTYVLLWASNLTAPVVWLPIQTNTADTNGVFNFSDLQATNYLIRFYRIGTP